VLPGCVPYTERHRALVYSCASGRKRSCRTLLVAEPRFNVFGIIPKMASYSARFRADTEVPPLVKGGFGNLQVGRRFLGGPQPVLNRFHKCITPPFDHVGLSDGSCELFLVAGASSRGEGRLGACGGGVPGAVVGPGLEDQDHGVVQRASPRVTFTVGAALALAVLGTGAAQVTEGRRVTARLGQEVTAPAERVSGCAQPGVAGGAAGAQPPAIIRL